MIKGEYGVQIRQSIFKKNISDWIIVECFAYNLNILPLTFDKI